MCCCSSVVFFGTCLPLYQQLSRTSVTGRCTIEQCTCTHVLLHKQFFYTCLSLYLLISHNYYRLLIKQFSFTRRCLLHVYRCTISFPMQLSLYEQLSCILVSLVYVFCCTRSVLLYILLAVFRTSVS